MKTQNVFLLLLGLIIVGGGAFFAGVKYQESKQSSPFTRQFNGTGRRMGGGRNGFRPVSGEIINVDEKEMTVKLQDGSSKIIIFSQKMALNKAEKAEVSDLKSGQTVAVFGVENTDGSITAQNIQLNPQSFGRGPQPTPAE